MLLTAVKPHRGVVHTPLRYPGGKTRLSGFLASIVREGGWHESTYVEPYAGGAGAALSLLHDEVVARLIINDLDPCMSAFWRAVVHDNEEFLGLFDTTPVSLENWHAQRDIYRRADATNTVGLGFATFFLNRTNRSGIMNAGVIGGQAQSGTYKIDARYNRQSLRQKLVWVGEQKNSIEVRSEDGVELLREQLPLENTFCYIDPPYFDKGSFLYMNSFTNEAHARLAELLGQHQSARWVVTYDDVAEIRKLYQGFNQGTFRLPYSAHTASSATERMILSDPVAELDGVMPAR